VNPYVGHSGFAERALAEARRLDAEIAARHELGATRITAQLVDLPADEHEAEIIARARRKR
jgi:hypothetical protein